MMVKRIYIVCKMARGSMILIQAFDDRKSAEGYLNTIKDNEGHYNINTVNLVESD